MDRIFRALRGIRFEWSVGDAKGCLCRLLRPATVFVSQNCQYSIPLKRFKIFANTSDDSGISDDRSHLHIPVERVVREIGASEDGNVVDDRAFNMQLAGLA